ncbi:MAG: hypothetical protein NTU88_17520 [Armatimonadetes bacterium]|nr:hypothetical protein [Armatimonadota bacterium]
MASQQGSHTAKGDISHRMFFFEEKLPAGAYSIHHVYAPVEKVECRVELSAPAYTEIGLGDPMRLENGSYRSYGGARSTDQRLCGVGVWESPDLLKWSPVRLGQMKVDGADTNMIRFEGIPGDQSALTGPQVIKLRDGRLRMYFWKQRDGHLRLIYAETDDGLRWRVPDFDHPVLYHPHDGGLWKLAEGLSVHDAVKIDLPPDQILARKRLWTNDSLTISYNEQLDRYECHGVWLHPAIPDRRVDVDNAPGVLRLIHRRFSEDGIHWSDAELIIMPDERDPWDLQFYFLTVQRLEDWMIGSLGYYRVADGMQTMDTDLCFSRDGYRWQRPVRGGWIPRAKEGSGAMDTMGIYAGGSWMDRGDKWLTLYDATPVPHNATSTLRGAMMGAVFPKHRLVGLAAGRVPGGFLTEPFFPAREDITLDASIRGSLRVELCDAFGRKLPGFHLMDSTPIFGDSEKHVLRWKDASVADHLFECLRLRFEFTDSEVYSVAFG